MTLISYGDIDKDAEKYVKEKFSTLDNALHFFPYNDKYIYDVTSLVGEHEFNKNFSDVYNSEKNSALFTTTDNFIHTIENSYSFVITLHNSSAYCVAIYLDKYKVLSDYSKIFSFNLSNVNSLCIE